MKFYLSCAFLFLISCAEYDPKTVSVLEDKPHREITVPAFQSIIDSAKVVGAILIYDLEANIYYSNNFKRIEKGYLPASTFKITNSIIALETGLIESDSSLIKWDGKKRRMEVWEQDLFFRDAFHFSCVPCYQEIAKAIGPVRMNNYLDDFEYGSMKVDSSNIDLFWLEGNSIITQREQIDFLKRFYLSELPISDRTETIMKRLMVIEESEGFKLSGKTGWSLRNGNNNGWYVGYIETQEKTYFFATNIEPLAEFDMDMFSMIRKNISEQAFQELSITN